VQIPERIREFLEEPRYCVMATINREGVKSARTTGKFSANCSRRGGLARFDLWTTKSR
jgi:hypothetical protein